MTLIDAILIFWLAILTSEVRKLKVADKPRAITFKFYELINGELKLVEGFMAQKVTESKKFVIKAVDQFGNPALLDGAPKWSSSDASLASVVASDDGMSADLVPVGPVGSVKIQVSADADMGEGVKDIVGEKEVELVAGDAVSVVIAEA